MTHENLSNLLGALARCVNPETGEIFDVSLFLTPDVLDALDCLNRTAKAAQEVPIDYEKWPVDKIYEELRQWRNDEAELREMKPFQVFWNSHLHAMAASPIVRREDLLNVDGIGPFKYEEYGDSIFDILKPYLDNYWEAVPEPLDEDELALKSQEGITEESNDENSAIAESSVTCRNCSKYRADDCFGNGDPATCEFFVYAADVDPEELARWRSLMGTATRIRLTGHGYHD